jgi:phosphoribosylformylglycinamidine cyclo-ligase
MAHVTGGGLTENVPRMLPAGCDAVVDRSRWLVPPLFRVIQNRGSIDEAEMFRAFNMGIGLVLACAARDLDRVRELLGRSGEPDAPEIGRVVEGRGTLRYA